MKGIDTGKSKIQKICDIIKEETIEPAQQEAREIVENAHLKAQEIIHSAEKQAAEMVAKASRDIEHKKKVFESSLSIACKQSLETLRQKIENDLFNNAFADMSKKMLGNGETLAKITGAIVEALERDGIDADISAYVGKAVNPRDVSEFLLGKIIERLREKAVVLGDFSGGVKVRLHNQRLTIDLSEESIKELVSNFVRKELRETLFKI